MKKIVLAIAIIGALLSFAMPAFAASKITISKYNIFFFVTEGKIGFQESLSYSNPNGEDFKIVLPKGALQVSSASAGGTVELKTADFKEIKEGMEATVKLPKGNDILELRYFVKPNGNLFDYTTKINYETKKIQLLSTGDVIPQGHALGQLPRAKAASGFYEVPVKTLKVGDALILRLIADPTALTADPSKPAQAGKTAPKLPGQAPAKAASQTSIAVIAVLSLVLLVLVGTAVYHFTKIVKQR